MYKDRLSLSIPSRLRRAASLAREIVADEREVCAAARARRALGDSQR